MPTQCRRQEYSRHSRLLVRSGRSDQPAGGRRNRRRRQRRRQQPAVKDAGQPAQIHAGQPTCGHDQPALQREDHAAEQRRRVPVGCVRVGRPGTTLDTKYNYTYIQPHTNIPFIAPVWVSASERTSFCFHSLISCYVLVFCFERVEASYRPAVDVARFDFWIDHIM